MANPVQKSKINPSVGGPKTESRAQSLGNSKTLPTNSNKPATSMAELMKRQATGPVSLKKGDTVEGTISKLTSAEILMSIPGRGEAWVLERDRGLLKNLLKTIQVGDKVSAQIISPEGDSGTPIVSLRRFMDEKVWGKLQELKDAKKTIQVKVDTSTRGGFLVTAKGGISGFLPNSHASFSNAQNLVGREVDVAILELDKPSKKIIFSQKQAVTVADFRKQVASFKPGDKIKSIITNVVSFGMFTSIPLRPTSAAAPSGKQGAGGQGGQAAVDGFIHISEVSWDKTEDLASEFNAGEEIEAVVLGVDDEARRINLSIKKLTPDVFEDKIKNLPVDTKTQGKVISILDSGVALQLDGGVEGFIKKEKIPPTVAYKEGEEINVTVAEIDKRKRRLNVVPVLKEKPIGYR